MLISVVWHSNALYRSLSCSNSLPILIYRRFSRSAQSSARAEAHDVQADDVRFWATSCTDGPVPELGDAVFVSQVKRAAFAEEIRAYMERDTH